MSDHKTLRTVIDKFDVLIADMKALVETGCDQGTVDSAVSKLVDAKFWGTKAINEAIVAKMSEPERVVEETAPETVTASKKKR